MNSVVFQGIEFFKKSELTSAYIGHIERFLRVSEQRSSEGHEAKVLELMRNLRDEYKTTMMDLHYILKADDCGDPIPEIDRNMEKK